MNQSVYRGEFRDPKQIVQLLQSVSGHKLKSNFEHKNSIGGSKLRDKKFAAKSEIDISILLRPQMKCEETTGKKVSCSHSIVKIIRRCHNDEEKLFKSMSNGKFCESPQNSPSVTANVIQFDSIPLLLLSFVNLNNRSKRQRI